MNSAQGNFRFSVETTVNLSQEEQFGSSGLCYHEQLLVKLKMCGSYLQEPYCDTLPAFQGLCVMSNRWVVFPKWADKRSLAYLLIITALRCTAGELLKVTHTWQALLLLSLLCVRARGSTSSISYRSPFFWDAVSQYGLSRQTNGLHAPELHWQQRVLVETFCSFAMC